MWPVSTRRAPDDGRASTSEITNLDGNQGGEGAVGAALSAAGERIMPQTNNTATRSYRIYLRDAKDHIAKAHDVDFGSDKDARHLAATMLEQAIYACAEVWDRARLVCTTRKDGQDPARLAPSHAGKAHSLGRLARQREVGRKRGIAGSS